VDHLNHFIQNLGGQMTTVLSTSILRLFVAAVLGGVIGLERELRHKPAGLRTNMFICFGAALFTLLSDQLAGEHTGDHTRIAAQVIPGIGFIGAGSILHSRGSVTGLTTAATLFVVASVGMAAGGGLYITAVFATGLILIALAALGRLERHFSLKTVLVTYEVSGKETESVIAEINRILDAEENKMQELRVAGGSGYTRVVFSVDSSPQEQDALDVQFHRSSIFSSVSTLSRVQHE